MSGYLCSVYDRRGSVYNPPAYYQSLAVVEREVLSAAKDPESVFSRFPDDFEMRVLASFNADSGLIEVLSDPVTISFPDMGDVNV